MRVLAGASLAAAILWLASAPNDFAAPGVGDNRDAAVLAEINFARTRPQAYARRLLLQPVSDWEASLDETGDADAFAEAITFLMGQAPLPPLAADPDLTAASLEHVLAQGPVGAVGHRSAGGESFDVRLRRHGVAGEVVAEDIAYGPGRASDVVRELIIDRGVPDRGHRRNIFDAELQAAGVTCGPHKVYGAMCVIDFAGDPDAGAPEAPQ